MGSSLFFDYLGIVTVREVSITVREVSSLSTRTVISVPSSE
jgi:hypothetical protein